MAVKPLTHLQGLPGVDYKHIKLATIFLLILQKHLAFKKSVFVGFILQRATCSPGPQAGAGSSYRRWHTLGDHRDPPVADARASGGGQGKFSEIVGLE